MRLNRKLHNSTLEVTVASIPAKPMNMKRMFHGVRLLHALHYTMGAHVVPQDLKLIWIIRVHWWPKTHDCLIITPL
jgi:hypothetical protein